MKQAQRLQQARARRIQRVRAKLFGTGVRPRLAVRRSLAHIYVQLVDDQLGRTLAAASDADIKLTKLRKTEIAQEVGKVLAERALAQGIKAAVFDRRDKKYHGRVKALADGARAGGLKF